MMNPPRARSGQYVRWQERDYRVGPLFHLQVVELVDEVTEERREVPWAEVSDLRQVETFGEHQGHRCKVVRELDDGRWLLAWSDDDEVDPATLGFGIEHEAQTFEKVVEPDELTEVWTEEFPLDLDEHHGQRRRAIEAQLRLWDDDPEVVATSPELAERARDYRAWLAADNG
jgi:hypothetical protein